MTTEELEATLAWLEDCPDKAELGDRAAREWKKHVRELLALRARSDDSPVPRFKRWWDDVVAWQKAHGQDVSKHETYVKLGYDARASQEKKLVDKVTELEAIFDMRHRADMRAVARWRAAAPGRELKQPDHADLVVFLLGELEAARPQEENSHG